MGVDPNWNLLNGGGVDNAVRTGIAMGETVRRAQDEREMKKALGAFAANPDDPAALQAVMARNPELGMRLADYADKRAFRSALSNYIAPNGTPNALLGLPGPSVAPLAPHGRFNALAGLPGAPAAQPGQSFNDTFAPYSREPAPSPNATPPVASSVGEQNGNTAPQGGPDLSVLGEPQTARDRAFLAMVRRDPIQALKIQSTLRDNFMDRVKAEHEFYGEAVQELSGMTNDADWQAALRRLAPMAQALGADLMAHVPPTYPGPDGVQHLLERALPIKQQLDYFMQQANIDADNARQDRNTDSLIATREGRLSEYQRHNQAGEANTRRRQDRRGGGRSTTPMRTETTRTGPTGTTRTVTTRTPMGDAPRPTATGPNGHKVEWNGKAWVPVR